MPLTRPEDYIDRFHRSLSLSARVSAFRLRFRSLISLFLLISLSLFPPSPRDPSLICFHFRSRSSWKHLCSWPRDSHFRNVSHRFIIDSDRDWKERGESDKKRDIDLETRLCELYLLRENVIDVLVRSCVHLALVSRYCLIFCNETNESVYQRDLVGYNAYIINIYRIGICAIDFSLYLQ